MSFSINRIFAVQLIFNSILFNDYFCLLNAIPPIKIAIKEKSEITIKLIENGMNEKPIIILLSASTP